MSESQDKKPTEVLRTRRLEIVDDNGKVRAVLGTDEQGVTSLSLFDQSERQRASLDASDAPEQMNGLGLFDANGRLQIAMGANTISEKGGFYYGPNGKLHAGINVDDEGGFFYGPQGEERVGLAMHEKGGGHFLNDTKGERRAGFNVDENSSSLYWCDVNEERRGGLGAYEYDQSGVFFSRVGPGEVDALAPRIGAPH